MVVMISGQIGVGKDTFCELFQKHSSIKWENKKFAYKLKLIVSLLTGCNVEDLENEDFKNQFLPKDFDLETWIDLNNESQTKKVVKHTYRELLQKLGTDLLRDKFHPQVHINALFADYKLSANQLPNWMITDLRFINEFESAEKYGAITIRIERSMRCCDWISSKYFNKIFFTQKGYIFLSTNNETLTKTQIINLIQLGADSLIKKPKHDKDWLKLIHKSETELNFFAENVKFDFIVNNDSTLEALEEKIKVLIKKIENGRY